MGPSEQILFPVGYFVCGSSEQILFSVSYFVGGSNEQMLFLIAFCVDPESTYCSLVFFSQNYPFYSKYVLYY